MPETLNMQQVQGLTQLGFAGLVFLALSTPVFSGLWAAPSEFQALVPYHALLIAVFCFAAVSAQAGGWWTGCAPGRRR